MAHTIRNKIMTADDLVRILCSFVVHGRIAELNFAIIEFVDECFRRAPRDEQFRMLEGLIQAATDAGSIAAAQIFIDVSAVGKVGTLFTSAKSVVRKGSTIVVEAIGTLIGR